MAAVQSPEQGAGRVALITGCSSGVGLATALIFLENQYRVYGVDVTPFDDQSLAPLEKNDGTSVRSNFRFQQADLTESGKCDEVVRNALEAFGNLNVLVNNAGIMDNYAAANTFTDVEYQRVMAVNLTAPLCLMRAALPHMLERASGRIINVCSRSSKSGAAAGLSYTSSKHALLGATKHTAWRFRNEGIRCNAVLPGGVHTNIGQSMKPQFYDEAAYQVARQVQTLHFGGESIQPRDIANTILFLASPQSRMINGAEVPVDKAWSTI